MKKYLVIILLLFTFCKKEKQVADPAPQGECYELDPDFFDERWDGTEPHSIYKHARWPCICPFDRNKIVFLRIDDATGEKVLRIQNLQTGEARTLLNGDGIMYNVSWSVKDWILFSNHAGIFKIKSNGDSLQQLLGAGHFYPLWSPKGDKFIVRTAPGGPCFLVSEEGEILKEMNLAAYVWSPNNNDIVATYKREGDDFYMAKYNIETGETEKIVSPKDVNGIDRGNEIAWSDSLNIIWGVRGQAFYHTDLQTHITKKIRDQCKNNEYSYYTMVPGDTCFYADSRKYKYLNDTPWVEMNVWRISIDGKNVTKIDVK